MFYFVKKDWSDMDDKSEIDNLKRRVGALEGVVGISSARAGDVGAEVLALKIEMTAGLQRLEAAVERVVGRIDTVNTQVWSLRDDLPDLIGTALEKYKA